METTTEVRAMRHHHRIEPFVYYMMGMQFYGCAVCGHDIEPTPTHYRHLETKRAAAKLSSESGYVNDPCAF